MRTAQIVLAFITLACVMNIATADLTTLTRDCLAKSWVNDGDCQTVTDSNVSGTTCCSVSVTTGSSTVTRCMAATKSTSSEILSITTETVCASSIIKVAGAFIALAMTLC